jgi:hypothetical protein
MTANNQPTEGLEEAKRWREELRAYLNLFEEAFDELHRAVTEQIGKPTVYVRSHYDYPYMSSLDSGFPSFRQAGALDKDSPRDYVGTVSPRGLLALIEGSQAKIPLQKITELTSFLHTHAAGAALDLEKWIYKGRVSEFPVETLVRDAVERYIHLHGLGPIDSKRRSGRWYSEAWAEHCSCALSCRSL